MMKIRLAAALLAVANAFSQPTAPGPPRSIEIDPNRPQDVVATVDGKPVTAEEYQHLILAVDPKLRDGARNDGREILKSIGWLRRMGAEAEKRQLHTVNPLKLQIELARIQLLSNAVVQNHEYEEVVTPFEQRGYYTANQALYSGVKLKLIYLPFLTETEELQAKRRAEDVHKKLLAGADFVAMVKEHSKDDASKSHDGDLGEVRQTDQETPPEVKKLAATLKDGEVSGPVRLRNGYFLFKRTGATIDPYEKVKDQIFTEIKQKRNLDWVEQHRKSIKVEMKPETASKDPKRIVAMLEGQPVTAAEVETLLTAMDTKLRQSLKETPEEMLRGVGFMRKMAKLGEEKGTDKTLQVRTQLEMTRLQALTNALIQDQEKQTLVTASELAQAYKDNLKYVSAAKLKIVFFSAAQENEAENQAALQLAKEVHEKIKGGADFVEMVKQYSKDPVSAAKNGDYGPVKITDDIPPAAKQAIWTLPDIGSVSAPAKLPNGYYIFKLIALEEPGLDKASAELGRRLRAAKLREWQNAQRSQVQVTLAK